MVGVTGLEPATSGPHAISFYVFRIYNIVDFNIFQAPHKYGKTENKRECQDKEEGK